MSDAYELRFLSAVKDDLARLEKPQAAQIIKKLQWVAANISEIRHDSLTGQ